MLVLPVALGLVIILVAMAYLASNAPAVRSVEPCFGGPAGPRPPKAIEGTFLFADLVGFTAFAEAEGDHAAARAADRLQWATRRALHGDAALVKTLGDGVMIVAATPAAATQTALALVGLVEGEPGTPRVSVGLHRGVAIEVGRDYVGSAVNVAARLVEQAEPGQVLCTDSVAALLDGTAVAVPLGATSLKGVRELVAVHELTERVATGGKQ